VRKMISKRVLTLVLAMLMVLSAAACGGASAPAEPNAGAAGASSPESGAAGAGNTDPLGKYEEPVTVTWAIMTSQVQKFHDNDTYENNQWSRLIKEKLNIDLKIAFSADGSTDAYKNKLNAVIASGDLPDIFKSMDVNVFKQLQQNGQLADLTDIYDKYATPEVKAYQTKYADSFKGVTVDGRIYGVPRMNDNFHEASYLWIRDDWLKNTNSQPPKTIDEFVALARTFATGDPDGNGKNGDAYGFVINKDLVKPGYATILGLVGAYGVPAYDKNIFYRDKDGKMTFSYLNPGMKPALSLLHDMYVQGLLDKEFTAKDNAKQEEDVAAGKIGMAFGNNWGTWYPYNLVYEKDKVITRPYPIPTAPGYDYKVGIENNATGQITMVSSSCKNPEAAIKILNLYEATVNANPTDFQNYWADEQYRLSPVYTDLPNEVYAPEVLEALETGSEDKLSPGAKPYYKYVVDFENGTDTGSNAYGTWGQMSRSGSLPIALKYKADGAVVQSILGADRPEVWVQNFSALETITLTAFTDIITGAKPVDFFDTYVQNWLKAGGQKTLDELDKMYPAN
jgi:putative aldouronate transport system substrate-binding protein